MSDVKKKILLLNSVPFVGGGEVSLLETACSMSRERFDVHFAVPSEGDYATRIRDRGFPVHFLNVRSPNTSRFSNPLKTLFRLSRLLVTEQFHLLHNNSLPYLYVAVLASRLAGIPMVQHVRDLVPASWFRLHHNWFIEKVDRILCITKKVAQTFSHLDGVRVVYNGVDPARYPSRPGNLRGLLNLADEEFLVGIVGYIIPRKGHDTFVQSAIDLLKKYPKMKFAIIGDDPFPKTGFKRSLVDKLKAANADLQVCFTGHLPNLEKVLGDLDVLTMPSWEEPFGRVVIEAMAAGVPSVACSTGGTVEIFSDGEQGLFVEPKNSSALVSAIAKLHDDKKLRENIIAAGRQHAENQFHIRKTATDVMAVYDELIGSDLL